MEKNPGVVFRKPKEAVIEERPVPKPEKGQALIRSSCTLISIGTEMTVFSGEFPAGSVWDKNFKYPYFPGYNNIGRVVDVGEGGDKKLIGGKVASWGSHSTYTVQDIDRIYKINSDVPDESAVFFTIAQIVMNGIRRSGLRWGDAVAVYGLGLLGQLTAIFARLCGARPVFAIDISDFRLACLPEDPAIVKIKGGKEKIADVVQKHNHGRMADIVFEVTGNAALIPSEFEILRTQGHFVVLSSPRDKTLFDFHDLCNSPSFTIIGAHNFSHPPVGTPDNPWTWERDFEFFIDLIADGEIDMGRIISNKIKYTEAPEIYSKLLNDRSESMGIILEW